MLRRATFAGRGPGVGVQPHIGRLPGLLVQVDANTVGQVGKAPDAEMGACGVSVIIERVRKSERA